VLLDKLTVTQLVKKFPGLILSKISLPCSQEPAIGLYSEHIKINISYTIERNFMIFTPDFISIGIMIY